MDKSDDFHTHANAGSVARFADRGVFTAIMNAPTPWIFRMPLSAFSCRSQQRLRADAHHRIRTHADDLSIRALEGQRVNALLPMESV